ncbi:hypothetical protein [Bradyrhizobium canariense]|uniref:Uncharacterized protein n=1 Tax=Bradyrhizobium canariense TaxID=255045 RepID=A0A1H2BF62_9BRAD|nr:hypothetical protein [Bradyrhizobium canariense]SDT56950.1 hypothetical protein SAMN05444158_7122 [Bradyrhizobium canariense]
MRIYERLREKLGILSTHLQAEPKIALDGGKIVAAASVEIQTAEATCCGGCAGSELAPESRNA